MKDRIVYSIECEIFQVISEGITITFSLPSLSFLQQSIHRYKYLETLVIDKVHSKDQDIVKYVIIKEIISKIMFFKNKALYDKIRFLFLINHTLYNCPM